MKVLKKGYPDFSIGPRDIFIIRKVLDDKELYNYIKKREKEIFLEVYFKAFVENEKKLDGLVFRVSSWGSLVADIFITSIKNIKDEYKQISLDFKEIFFYYFIIYCLKQKKIYILF